MEPGRRFNVEGEQAFADLVATIVIRAARFLDDGNPRTLGEAAHRADKVEMLVVHDETKNRPARTAAEAVIGLPLRVDVEGRAFLAMKWTERPPACARAFEREIRTDDLDDVVGFGDALDGFFGNAGHAAKLPCGSNRCEGEKPLLFFALPGSLHGRAT